MEVSMFNWFKRSPQPKPDSLTYPDHYMQTVHYIGGEKCELTLVHVGTEGPFVNLAYQWEESLSDQEADKVDTRARAYITCAIYDAAITARLSCKPGPLHGQRPSWYIGEEKMPISLVSAGFEVSDKTCWMLVGPGIGHGRLLMSTAGTETKKLASGFQASFANIKV